MNIHFDELIPADDGCAVALLAFTDAPWSNEAKTADAQLHGLLSRSMANGKFTGAAGESLCVPAVVESRLVHWIVIGAGDKSALGDTGVEHAAANAHAAAEKVGARKLELRFPSLNAWQAARAALGAELAAYRFDRHKTQLKPQQQPFVTDVYVRTEEADDARAEFAELAAVLEGVRLARDLTSEPPNVLFPKAFADRVRQLAQPGLSIEILDESQMRALGMGALLGVGQGSTHESQLVVMHWRGGAPQSAPVAFVGKGVCFDSGGLSIKTSEGMEQMKWDMGGAAAVAGLLHALAVRKAKVNAVGVLALVENMPDGNAQRPGDVVRSMSGQTIEILNTDAEGRLILADALWYCQHRFDPQAIVDVATLTGATEIALGKRYAGFFCNQDMLAGALSAASLHEDEPLWRMPLIDHYAYQLESAIADVKNIGERSAGAITAALFLQRFVNDRPWAHLDIAGVAWKKPSRVPTIPEGATGFGVRLLNRFVRDQYESAGRGQRQ